MQPVDALSFLNERRMVLSDHLQRCRRLYYATSLHIEGAAPKYTDLRRGAPVVPFNYLGPEYQQIFESVIFSRHPRESEATRQWRMSQFQPITQEFFSEVITMVRASLFNDAEYHIEIENPNDHRYIIDNNFFGHDLAGYFSFAIQLIFEDPNGYFVVMPRESADEMTTDQAMPMITFVKSTEILAVEEGRGLLWKRGKVVWLANREAYYRFIEQEDGAYRPFPEAWYYPHKLGELPAIVAGGNYNAEGGFYDSWVASGRSWAYKLLAQQSSLDLVDKEASHPWITEVGDDCETCNGLGVVPGLTCSLCGDLEAHHEHNDCEHFAPLADTTCPTCRGMKQVSRNPGERLLVDVEDFSKTGGKLISIVSPEISVNDYHAKRIAELQKSLRIALHLNVVDQAQSGVAKEIDLEIRKKFLMEIANDMFDRILWQSLRYITGLRNVTSRNGELIPQIGNFQITKPKNFVEKKSGEILADLKAAKEAGIPVTQLYTMISDYIDRQQSGDPVAKKKLTVSLILDPLFLEDDLQTVALNGFADIDDIRLHLLLPSILERLILERGREWFTRASVDEIGALASQLIPSTRIPNPLDV